MKKKVFRERYYGTEEVKKDVILSGKGINFKVDDIKPKRTRKSKGDK